MSSIDSVFFLGFGLPPSIRKEFQERQVITSSSAALFGWKAIVALSHVFAVYCAVVPQTDDYPSCDKLLISGRKFCSDGIEGVVLPFFNLFFLKHLTRFFSAIIAFFKWRGKAERPIVVVHGVHNPFLLIGILSKIFGCRFLVIVTDLPSALANPDGNRIRAFLKRVDAAIAKICVARSDAIVALAPKLADWAGVGRHLVVPGIIDGKVSDSRFSGPKSERFIMTYTGMLSVDAGAQRLLDIIELMPGVDVRVQICGDGPLRDKVVECARRDSRVLYFGSVSAEDAKRLLRGSSLLLNPRPLRKDFSDASFPSKLLDYMATDIPILTTRIESMPDWMIPSVSVCEDSSLGFVKEISSFFSGRVDVEKMILSRVSVRGFLSPDAVGKSIKALLE